MGLIDDVEFFERRTERFGDFIKKYVPNWGITVLNAYYAGYLTEGDAVFLLGELADFLIKKPEDMAGSIKVGLDIEVEKCPYWNYGTHSETCNSCHGCDCDTNGNTVYNIRNGVMINRDRYCTIDSGVYAKFQKELTNEH